MLKFTCDDGHQTYVSTASYALLYWRGYTLPEEKLPENPKPFEVYVIGKPREGPYDPKFLMLLIGGIERNYGTAPQISEKLLTEDWYKNLPDIDDHNDINFLLNSKNEKIVEYEQNCWNVLLWLFQHGNIVCLEKLKN